MYSQHCSRYYNKVGEGFPEEVMLKIFFKNLLISRSHLQKFESKGLIFPAGSVHKESASNARDPGSIPGLERALEGGNGNSLQYFCLGNPMDRGTWRATVHEVAKNWTRLSD